MTYLDALFTVLKWAVCGVWLAGSVIAFMISFGDIINEENEVPYNKEIAILSALSILCFIAFLVYKWSD